MRLQSPPLTELHALAAVARLGNITLAAEELCVTQGAISRAIMRLEEHFGKQLLSRGNRRVQLTEAGKNLLDQIGPALEKIEQVSGELRRASSSKTLTLSVSPSFFSNWLVLRLGRFERKHPDIVLKFAHYKYGEEDFSDDTQDVSIRAGALQSPSIFCEYLMGKSVAVICHPSLVQNGTIKEPRDLLGQPLLYHRMLPNIWSLWFREIGMPDVEIKLAHEFDYVTILIEAVAAGVGVAIVPRCLLDQVLELGKVAAPFNHHVESDRGFYFCGPKAKSDLVTVRLFREWLSEESAAYSS